MRIRRISVSSYPQLCSALLAHSCTVIRFSVGDADQPNAPHPHRFFADTVTWRRTGGVVYCTTHDSPTINSHPVRAHGYPLARTWDVRAPWVPTQLITAAKSFPHSHGRPDFRKASIRPWAGGCVRRHPGPHASPMRLGGRQVAVDVREVVLIYPAGASPLHPPRKEPTCRVRARQSDGLFLDSSRRSSL